jgi:hypothetical protein
MPNETIFRVINVEISTHSRFKARCALLREPMSKRASFLLELDNAKAFPYNVPSEKELKEKKKTKEEETKRIAKEIASNKLMANLAARIGLTEAYVERIEAVARKENTSTANGLILDLLLVEGEGK